MEALELLGLDEKEQRFYLAALELGRASVSSVAAKAGVGRTLGYDILQRLQERGFLTHVDGEGGRLVVAEDPRSLLQDFDRKRQAIEDIVPELRSLFAGHASKPRVRVYDGVDGIRRALLETLDCASKTLYGVLSMRELVEVPSIEWMETFIRKRVERGVKLLVVRSAARETEAIWPSSTEQLRELRYAPPELDLSMTMYVSDNKVVYVSSKRENYAIVVDSIDFAKFARMLFYILWKASEPTVK